MGSRRPSPEAAVEGVEQRVEALSKGFRSRYANEQGRLKDAGDDSEFWCCVMFRSTEHKRAFLRLAGLLSLGETYIDGHKAAAVLGIELPPAEPARSHRPPSKRWAEFTGQEVIDHGEQARIEEVSGGASRS